MFECAETDFWVRDVVVTFALQAVLVLVGVDVVKDRLKERGWSTDVIVHDEIHSCNETSSQMIGVEEQVNNTMGESGKSTLLHAVSAFDFGCSFDGAFTNPPLTPIERIESHAKKYLALLSRVIVAEPKLLCVYFDLYGILVKKTHTFHSPTMEIVDVGVDNEFKWNLLLRLMKEDIAMIIPALLLKIAPEDLFEPLMACDPLAQSLIEVALTLMYTDLQIPPSSSMVRMVNTYIRMQKKSHSQIASMTDEESTSFSSIIDVDTISLMIPVLGGGILSFLSCLLSLHLCRWSS